MGFLDIFRIKPRTTEQRASPSERASAEMARLLQTTIGSTAQLGPIPSDADLAAWSTRIPELAGAVAKNAIPICGATWRVTRPGPGERRVVALDHPFNALLKRPNALMSPTFFAWWLSAALDVTGGCYLHAPMVGGVPQAIYPYPTSWVHTLGGEKRTVHLVIPNGATREIPVEELVLLRVPDTGNPYAVGVGLGMSAATDADAAHALVETQAALLHNRTSPAGIAVIEGLSDKDRKSLKEEKDRWLNEHRGPSKAGHTLFTAGKAVSYVQIGMTVRDAQLVEQADQIEGRIARLYSINPTVSGAAAPASKVGVLAALELHARAREPLAWLIAEALTEIARRFPDSRDIEVDVVGIRPSDADLVLRGATVAPSAFTVNELRVAAGLEPDPARIGEYLPAQPGQQMPSAEEPDDADAEADLTPGGETE